MDLDPNPVELPLHRRALEARHSLSHSGGRGGEHREDRSEELEADRAQSLLALCQRSLGGAREVAREHERAARELGRNAGGLRDRVDHQAGERSLPQLAREEPLDEVRLLVRRAGEEVPEDPPSGRGRAAPSRRLDLRDRAVDLVDGEGRLQGGRLLEAVDRRVADPDPPLPRHAGEEADRDRNLVRVEPPQELGEKLDLARARARTGYLSRGSDDVGEQCHRRARRIATARTAASTSAGELTIPGPSRT